MFDKDVWAEQQERIERDYADYLAILRQEAKKQNVCGPHCDAYVLHKPAICQYCDHFPVLQQFRVAHSIAFTGDEAKENERPCPATLHRPVEQIHRWQRNRPFSL